MLYIFLFGVILCIVGLWILYPSCEGMANMESILLSGLTPNGTLFIANDGLTNIPNWKAVTEGFEQVSGSSGQLVGVDNANVAHYGTLLTGASYTWSILDGSVTQVSMDFPMIAGINESKKLIYIKDVTKSTLFIPAYEGNTYTYISIKGGAAYAIGTENVLYYTPNFIESVWVNVSGTLAGRTFLQVVFDGSDVAVLDSTNTVFYADTNVTVSPNWRELKGAAMKQISLTNHMIYGVGTNDKIYFSLSQTPSASWTLLPGTQPMKHVVCFSSNSSMVNTRIADTAACKDGFTRANGSCYSKCPEGYVENGSMCNGIPVLRPTRATNTQYPVLYSCPSGYEVYMIEAATCNKAGSGDVSEYMPEKEVYRVKGGSEEAVYKCKRYGGVLATAEQIAEAGLEGDATYTATCYGVKPPEAQFTDIEPFRQGQWNRKEQCPLGHYLHMNPDNCYSVCPTGTTPKEGACAFPDGVTENTIRTFKPPFKTEKKVPICNTDEHFIHGQCAKTCTENELSDSVNCTPKSISRTRDSEVESQICKSNEIFYKGTCIYDCPPGTKKIGGSCVEGFQATSCTKTSFGSYNKWLCDTEELATNMLNNSLDPNDQICIADDPTTGMYFCESVRDILNNTGYANRVQMNYSSSCDVFMKSYTDLSNNLTNIVNMQTGLMNGDTQLNNATQTLDQIYKGLQCNDGAVNACIQNPSNPSCTDATTASCVQIKRAYTDVNTNYTNIRTNLGAITPTVTNLTNERTNLRNVLNKYKCNTPWK